MTVITEQDFADNSLLHLSKCVNQGLPTLITSSGFLRPKVNQRLVLMVPLGAYPDLEKLFADELKAKDRTAPVGKKSDLPRLSEEAKEKIGSEPERSRRKKPKPAN